MKYKSMFFIVLFTLAGCAENNSDTTLTKTYTAKSTSNNGTTITVFVRTNTGGATFPTHQTIKSNKTASFTVTPSNGYEIDNVTGCNGTLTNNIYTTGAITSICYVDVTFKSIKEYLVTFVSNYGGSISPMSKKVEAGKTASFIITPNNGYEIKYVIGCDGATLEGNIFTISSVISDCSFTVTFKPKKDVKMLFMHFYFAEEGPSSVPYSISNTRNLVENGENSAISFFKNISYDKTKIIPSYMGLYALSKPKSEFQNEAPLGGTLIGNALEIAEKNSELNSYDMIVMMLPKLDQGYPGCAAHLGNVNRTINGKSYYMRYAWLSGNNYGCYNRALMFHEIGHTYGMFHSSAINCTYLHQPVPIDLNDPLNCGQNDEGTLYKTGDGYGIMGGYRGHPNVFWKLRASWLDKSQINTANTSIQVTLDAFEVKSEGLKGFKIPLPEQKINGGMSYWGEYRTQPTIDNDTGNINRNTNQIQLRLNNQYFNTIHYKEQLLDGGMILKNIGDIFHDVYRGIKVTWKGTNTSTTPSTAIVDIERSKIELSSTITNDVITINFKNNGSEGLDISQVSILGRNPSSFDIVDDQCGGKMIKATNSCLVKIRDLNTNKEKAVIVFNNTDQVRPTAAYSLNTQ